MSYRNLYLTPLEYAELLLKAYVRAEYGDLREKAHPTDITYAFSNIIASLGVAYEQAINAAFEADNHEHTHEEAEGQQSFDELHEDVGTGINED
jgi:hypothetical protein